MEILTLPAFSPGDEFYIREWPELVGRTFLEVLTMFENAVPLGIRTPEGQHIINPEDSFVVHQGPCFMLDSTSR